MTSRSLLGVVLAGTALVVAWLAFGPRTPAAWTDADLAVLRSLSIDSLPEPAARPI